MLYYLFELQFTDARLAHGQVVQVDLRLDSLAGHVAALDDGQRARDAARAATHAAQRALGVVLQGVAGLQHTNKQTNNNTA